MTTQDWVAWHETYDDPESFLARRLRVIQHRVREALDTVGPGPVRVLSMCAGQGRDLLGVLADHPRAADVQARLVELDPRNVAVARESAPPGVAVVLADAGTSDAYDGIAPVDIALVCGVFGNISDQDIRTTVEHLPMFLRPGGTVIWTRHRVDNDLPTTIRGWFTENGFTEVAFDSPADTLFSVGTNRLAGAPTPFLLGVRLFEFTR
ncbi:class I SAM-dependent methyltransferase [Actinocrispum wychmicini]|uniref:16S rRNA G966 N2-methylase RsmD n=1 Tax=Actinocrispum wychmicini TaxID=1213861 RepID=A0A4R2ITL5_9PSEU|nr:class I SAM-dependent methyltransferase [Actinocrispum wychmicini]TCO48803.1 16S rRNA G966 N2-methylase RsmD [Actinocrispum wychmicini]